MVKFLAELTVNLFKRNISPLAFVYAGSHIDKTSRIHRSCKVRHSDVGAHSYVAAGSWLTNVEVGRFCSIGNNVAIGLATHTLNHLSSSPLFTLRKNATGVAWVDKDLAENTDNFPTTHIADDVWIGSNTMIMSGVSVGVGAVIGAGAVVTKDVPPYSVVVGVPARVVRQRFEPEGCQKLLDSRWWQLSDSVLSNNLELFQQPLDSKNIDQIIASLKKIADQ